MSQMSITSFISKRPATSNDPIKGQSPLQVKRLCSENVNSLKTPEKVAEKSTIESTSPIMPSKIDTKTIIGNMIKRGATAMHVNIGPSWFRALQAEFNKKYFFELSKFVSEQRSKYTVYPPEERVYTWTHNHDIKSTRVVILGQDPYHGPNQAHGLCFSVAKGVRPPPSLLNIYKELEDDIKGFKAPDHGDLSGWSQQGVLLLNACLTVTAGQPNSHANKGWETLTDSVISWISKNSPTMVVFLLWGAYAGKKQSLIAKRHTILTSVHPSPLSAHRGFLGCKHFSKTNEALRKAGLPEIDWSQLP